MKPDRGLVQHIEDAGGAVTHSPGQLHSLPFSGGKGGRGTVKCQVSQPQVQKSLCAGLKRLADTFRHGTHFFRKRRGHVRDPFHKIRECHAAGGVKRDSLQPGGSGGFRQTASPAVRAGIFFQEFFHPFHAFLVFYF